MLTVWFYPVSHLWNASVNSSARGADNPKCRHILQFLNRRSCYLRISASFYFKNVHWQYQVQQSLCASFQSSSQQEPWSVFKTHRPTSIVPRIINLGGYATFYRDHMQPIKKLIWKSAQMTGQIRLSVKSCFVKTFPRQVRLDNDRASLNHLKT